jgi:hypothetical protein
MDHLCRPGKQGKQLKYRIERAMTFPWMPQGKRRDNKTAKSPKPKDIDDYIAQFSDDVQAILEKVRATICHAAAEAKETIGYGMLVFNQHGILV